MVKSNSQEKKLVQPDVAKIIDTLGDLKTKIKTLSEEEKSYVAEIKKVMSEEGIKELSSSSGNFKATLSTSTSGSFKEAELLTFVKKTFGDEVFNSITTLKLDEEKLENALFNNVIPPAKIKKFQTLKEVTRLIIK